MIAALHVETDGCYFGLPDVDPWDIVRDARISRQPPPGLFVTIRTQSASKDNGAQVYGFRSGPIQRYESVYSAELCRSKNGGRRSAVGVGMRGSLQNPVSPVSPGSRACQR